MLPNRPGSSTSMGYMGTLTMKISAYMMCTTCLRGAQTAASRATSRIFRSKTTNHNIRTARQCAQIRPCRGRGTHRKPGLSSRDTSRITTERSRCSQMPSRSPRPSSSKIVRARIGHWTSGETRRSPPLTTNRLVSFSQARNPQASSSSRTSSTISPRLGSPPPMSNPSESKPKPPLCKRGTRKCPCPHIRPRRA
jgi:hypothetical protein